MSLSTADEVDDQIPVPLLVGLEKSSWQIGKES